MKLITKFAALSALLTSTAAMAANNEAVAEACCALAMCCGLPCC
ncbi:hypothetical protein [Qipengyuania sp. ASV99]